MHSTLRNVLVLSPLLLVSGIAFAAGGDGPPLKAIGVHLANFVLLFTVLFFLVRKPVAEALKARQGEVKHEIDESNAKRKDAQTRFDEIEARLNRFENEVAELKAQAEKEAAADREYLRQRTAADIESLKQLTEQTIRDEGRKARAALQAEAVGLAVGLAEERLRASINDGDQERLAGEFLLAVKQEAADA